MAWISRIRLDVAADACLRATIANEIESSAARNRDDQCVIPQPLWRPPGTGQRRGHDRELVDLRRPPERGSSCSALIPPCS